MSSFNDRLPASARIHYRNGIFEIAHHGRWYALLRDPYYLLLTVPWAGFFLLMAFFYTFLNSGFALLYLLVDGGVANMRPGSFTDAFFFSVQTLGSIGYGFMYPASLYAHIIVALESFTGILLIALMTGVAFARVSRPTAKVIFSKPLLISNFNGKPSVMFRSANQRRNQIIEAQVSMYLMVDTVGADGSTMRRVFDLPLVRSRTPNFSLTWTVIHQIDSSSPLAGETPESLKQKKAMFIVSLVGIDDVLSQTIYARKSYGVDDISWGGVFEDIMEIDADGHRRINYRNFHKLRPGVSA
jgi:inward rectifier potassium channel